MTPPAAFGPITRAALALVRTGRYQPGRAVELAVAAVHRAAGRGNRTAAGAVVAWHRARPDVVELAHGADPRVIELARYVRTAAGAARYGQPIGSLITRKPRKSRALSGGERTRRALDRKRTRTAAAQDTAVGLLSAPTTTNRRKAVTGAGSVSAEQRKTLQGLTQPQLYAVRAQIDQTAFNQQKRVALTDAINAELARRADARVRGLSDEQLGDAIASSLRRNRLAEFDRYAAEEQRRADAREKTVARRRARAEAERDRKAAEYARLLDIGEDPMQAEATVYGTSIKKQREQAALAWLRANGHHGDSLREAARSAFTQHVADAYARAEDDTRGTLLTNAAEARGIDPQDLFTGPEARARKWASEELRSWWDVNGRPTFDEFLDQLLDDPASAARSRNARSDFLA